MGQSCGHATPLRGKTLLPFLSEEVHAIELEHVEEIVEWLTKPFVLFSSKPQSSQLFTLAANVPFSTYSTSANPAIAM